MVEGVYLLFYCELLGVKEWFEGCGAHGRLGMSTFIKNGDNRLEAAVLTGMAVGLMGGNAANLSAGKP